MLKRKNFGTLLIGSSIALGLFSLAGAIVWWQQGMNVLIGSLVFVLYAIGQWMTVLYWQRIQEDWETTGEVLGRLQQAVSDIPAALDANLKSIATRLTEGQAQALSKLQSEVNEGARITLEKGSALIGDSIAKNIAAPLESMKTLLTGFSSQSDAQGVRLEKLAQTVGEDSRKSVAQGAELVAGSLDRNLKAPLAALEAKLLAWTQHAEAQTESARGLGESVLSSQREGAAQSQRLADALAKDLKSLAASQSAQSESLLAAWAERASASQSDSETRLQALQAGLLHEVTSKLQAAQAAQAAAQERLLEKAMAGVDAQAKSAQSALAAQSQSLQTAAADQARTARASAEAVEMARAESATAFADGLESLKATTLELMREVEAKASSTLEAQSQLGLEVAGKVSDLADRMNQGSQDVAELAHTAQINQTEMQAGVAMLNSGLSSILDRLEKQAAAGDGYQSLLADLGRTLADFQERSAEILVENALKTQEILMEVLRNQEGRGEPAESAAAAMAT